MRFTGIRVSRTIPGKDGASHTLELIGDLESSDYIREEVRSITTTIDEHLADWIQRNADDERQPSPVQPPPPPPAPKPQPDFTGMRPTRHPDDEIPF